MEDQLLENMVVIVAVAYLLDKVFGFVSSILKRRNGTHSGDRATGRVEAMIENQTTTTKELNTNIQAQTMMLKELVVELKHRPCMSKNRS